VPDPFDTPDNGALSYLDGPSSSKAPPPTSPTDQANARLGQYDAAMDKQIQKLDALSGEEADIYKRRGAAMDKATGAAMAASDRMTKQGDQALDTFNKNTQQIQQFKPPDTRQLAMQWMAIASTFGAIAGARSRYHATTALNAFAGAMKGWAQGDAAGFQKNYDTWQANAEAASRNNERVLRQYQMTMQNAKLNLDQKMAQVQMIASQDQDQLMAVSAQQKNVTQISELLDKKAQVGERYYEHTQTLIDHRQQQEDKTNLELAKNGLMRKPDGSIGVDSSQSSPIEMSAQAIAKYDQAPLSSAGTRGPINRIIMARVQEINPNYDATRYKEKSTAQTAFGTGKQGDAIRSMNTAVAHLGTLEELMGALGSGDKPTLNRLSQMVAQQTGDPAPTNFDAAKAIVAKEVVKAIVAGGGGVSERQEASDLINRAASPEQLRGAIETIKKLLGGQLGGLRRQYETSTGGTNFDSMLSPEAQKLLPPRDTAPAGQPGGGQSMSDADLLRQLGIADGVAGQ
jgi:hypothetical protein